MGQQSALFYSLLAVVVASAVVVIATAIVVALSIVVCWRRNRIKSHLIESEKRGNAWATERERAKEQERALKL